MAGKILLIDDDALFRHSVILTIKLAHQLFSSLPGDENLTRYWV